MNVKSYSLKRISVAVTILLIIVFLGGCGVTKPFSQESHIRSQPRWWKGNLHTHSFWSDGKDYPEMIVKWYKENGYNFLTLSEHNILSQGKKWVEIKDLQTEAGLFDKYLQCFHADWVQTRNVDDIKQVQLKPLNEFRHLFGESDRFMLIQGEELTPGIGHVNAINTVERIGSEDSQNVRENLQNNIDAVLAQEKKTGREMLSFVNHPNWRWDLTAEDMLALTGCEFFELYNGGDGSSNNYGDDEHASMERVWDIILAMRLGRLGPGMVYGLATDDAHTYHETGPDHSNPGRGWVVVRSPNLTPESIIKAMKAGNFYSSTGVVLKDIQFDGRELKIKIADEWGVDYTTQFLGTMKEFNSDSKPVYDEAGNLMNATRIYSDEIGKVLKEVKGRVASYTLTGDELYVRATVTSTRLKNNPHVTGEVEVAWVQPVVPGVK